MNHKANYKQVINRLKENNMVFSEMRFSNAFKFVICERGARVLGPYKDDVSEGVFWTNKVFLDSAGFKSFLVQKDWNIGGDRIWIAPEFPFFNKSRADFFNSYTVQERLDPGSYTLKEAGDTYCLNQKVSIEMFESDYLSKAFSMQIAIKKAANPLRYLDVFSKASSDIEYCGYQTEVTIKDQSPRNTKPLEMWNLSQINPGGEIYIPYNHLFEFVDYYDPIDEEYLIVDKNYAKIRATGDRRYKVGIKSATTMGRAGYLYHVEGDNYCLYIKNYFNNPSSEYCCEPYDKPGERGCSLYVFNDSGDIGGFTEFECSGNTIEIGDMKHKTTDKVNNWFFFGEKEKLNTIMKILLGIEISE